MLSADLPRPDRSKRAPGFAGLAFEQLRAGLHRFLLRRVRHAQQAEDLEQEVYLRLLRAPNKELVRCPEAYVYRIASNVANRFTRREREGRVDFDSLELDDAAAQLSDETPPPEESYDIEERERRLQAIVARLPPMQKAVFVLARYQGLAHAQIADQLDISVHTVKKHMLRAIDFCRQALKEQP